MLFFFIINVRLTVETLNKTAALTHSTQQPIKLLISDRGILQASLYFFIPLEPSDANNYFYLLALEQALL